ncbi:MAG: preprotein translocase subunit SecA, partial [Gemmatimonadota bacterium]
MIKDLLSKVFGTRHERELKRIRPILDAIAAHGQRLRGVSDAEVQGQTAKFRATLAGRTAALEARIADLKGRKRQAADAAERERIDVELSGADGRGGVEGEFRTVVAETLDELLPEAFATVREAARRLVGTTVQVTGQPLAWDMVHYEVQLIGGLQLHLGRIAEMATGEGKTLVATLPLYLNALPGRGAHLVTVNSYLARRDSQWMGHLFRWLGLTVACLDDTEPGTADRRAAYHADITYGTNNEFGFDYLRDNMVTDLAQRVQRAHVFAIIDEVDSILIDEARTPLIISGPVGNEADAQYAEHNAAVARIVRSQTELVNRLVGDGERALAQGDRARAGLLLFTARLGGPKNRRLLKALQEQGVKQLVQATELEHIADRKLPAAKQQFRHIEDELLFVLDERNHTVHLTDRGVDALSPSDHEAFLLPDIATAMGELERAVGLSPAERLERRRTIEAAYALKSERLNIVHQLLRAHALYERDVNYVVQDGQVLIVDEFTGRTMPGRRWSEGLHQAVEAKEGVQVKGETQTLATVTIQNFFRMYEKLGGMTGTAETEETEFFQIYGLEVAVIPTNRPIVRDDRQDLVYRTRKEKYDAIVGETERLHKLGYPVLVGTTSVDASETLSRMFKRAGVPHNVLNAKYHQREAEIVALAGQPGAVTIATNMAGRGTDIKLGKVTREQLIEHWQRRSLAPRTLTPDASEEQLKEAIYRKVATQELHVNKKDAETLPLAELEVQLLRVWAARHTLESPKSIERADADTLRRWLDESGRFLLHRIRWFESIEDMGGLHVIGTERHEARRIDNQLRGRSGRQGDNGSTRFFVSLEDDLMKLFAGETTMRLLSRLGMKEGESIEHPMLSKSIENAQRKVEERNFQIRKNVLEFDEVMEHQRQTFYGLRQRVLEGRDVKG